MTQEKQQKIHKLYGILFTFSALLAGLCLIVACLQIYRTGIANDASQIYTREIVAQAFAKISTMVYICLALMIGGLVLDLALPIEKKQQKPEKNLPLIRRKLQEKTDLDACDETLRKAVAKEQKQRQGMDTLVFILLFTNLYGIWDYAADPTHWDANSTPSMVTAVVVMLVRLFIPFIFTVFAVYRSRKSLEREIALMRQAAAQAPQEAEKAVPKMRSNRVANIVRTALLIIGALLVILGACNEGTADILTKAVNICTECVGLG